MFITFIVVLFFIIFILGLIGTVASPFVNAQNNKEKLKEMDDKIKDFESKTFLNDEEKDKAKQLLKKELINIKAGIIEDEKAVEQARDKISIL